MISLTSIAIDIGCGRRIASFVVNLHSIAIRHPHVVFCAKNDFNDEYDVVADGAEIGIR